jgi:DNA replication protein DnaC
MMWYARELGLACLAAQAADTEKMAREQGWTLEQTLRQMLRAEYERRLAGRQKQRIKTAGFTQLKYLDQLNRDELPEGIRPILPRLETLDFIRERRNVVLYGNPGTGKTHVATALAIKACMEGMHVLFTSVPRLITQVKECK